MKPRSIVVSMLQETGHLNPTFRLLRGLRSRGHDVRFFAIPDLAPLVESQGFETEPWFPDVFPAGFAAEDQRLGAVARRRRITHRFGTVADRLLAGAGPAAALERRRPDLLLVDVNEPRAALLAEKLGLSMVLINTSLPQTWDPGVPPIRSARPFAAGPVGRLRVGVEWALFLAKRRASAELASGLGARPPYDVARRIAPRFGVTPAALDVRTAYMPQLKHRPELVLCPEAFDFPRPAAPGRHYIESVDRARVEPPFSFDFVPPGKPLVYCSLGTQVYRPRETPAFLRALSAVFARRKEWQLLLSIVRHPPPEDLGALPGNVNVVRGAPQLTVLKRARVMITHGGLGSVKECLLQGVPMLVVPLDIDQPGNAARVEHHRVGLRLDVARPDALAIERALENLLSGAFAAPVRAMQEAFTTVEEGTRGIDFVEAFLDRPG